MDVRSAVGQGTRFTLSPEVQVERPSAAFGNDDLAPVGGQRVLVVEDNLEGGQFCTQILDGPGYATAWAADVTGSLGLAPSANLLAPTATTYERADKAPAPATSGGSSCSSRGRCRRS